MKIGLRLIVLLGFCSVLFACGGGGGGGGSASNAVPVAIAGPDQSVNTGSIVTLDGAGSNDPDNDLLTYHWALTSRPTSSAATLSDASVVRPTFTADQDGTYLFSLVVNDGKSDSTVDTVSVIASTLNAVPVANAGSDQNVNTGAVVYLDGTASSDADGDTLGYLWFILAKPSGSSATLSGKNTAHATFTADVDGTYLLNLTVSDGATGGSRSDTVTITATTFNAEPVSNAGADQNTFKGEVVALDGSTSNDADGDTLTYQWAFTSKPVGSTAVLSGALTETPTFLADKSGLYIVSLVVNDGLGNSVTDSVAISVADPPISSTVTFTWTGSAIDRPIGGLNVVVDYNQAKVSYGSVATGVLTAGWYADANDNGDTLNTGMMTAGSFDGGLTGTVMELTFNVVTGGPVVSDFVVTSVTYVDEQYNTVNLPASAVSVTVENQF